MIYKYTIFILINAPSPLFFLRQEEIHFLTNKYKFELDKRVLGRCLGVQKDPINVLLGGIKTKLLLFFLNLYILITTPWEIVTHRGCFLE